MEGAPAVMDGENGKTLPKKSHKRKRESSAMESLSDEQKHAQIEALKQEMKGLFGYYRELMGQAPDMISGFSECSSVNAMAAVLMEEKSLPLSKLVDEIYTKLKEKMETLPAAAVKTAVVSVGQRVMYGVPNADADVLEDETESCLWCWETRDLKMVPKAARGMLKIRRVCRKKIHERIIAVSAMIAALQRAESEKSCRNDVKKAAEKLGKILSEADIRLFMDNMQQKNNAEMAEKDAKREEQMLIKQMERNRRETEKEKKKMERQMIKERLQCEKEQKLLQDADNCEKHKEKEESELRKRKKNQQDDSEREHKRRQKEQAELKKQVAVQKQASIMERFLKRNQTIVLTHNKLPFDEVTGPVSSSSKDENANETVIHAMDSAFSEICETSLEDLRGMLFASWHHLGRSVRSSSKQHWGMRKKPKGELFPGLKLSSNKGPTLDNENSTEKQEDALEEKNLGCIPCASHCDSSPSSGLRKSRRRVMQLLQFDKSFRPAFYGIWPRQSQVIGPRHPLKKDPDLDYEIDSDEEWEEQEPGESLSDCENDEEEGCSRADDEDDSEDGFFVPDGYLSEDEGVQVDRRMDTDSRAQDDISPASEQDQEIHEFCAMLHRERHLYGLTEHALKKCQPLIICNLMHEKTPLLNAKEVDGPQKTEQICLQALAMKTLPGSPLIEITINGMEDDDQELGNSPCTPLPSSSAKHTPDLDLLTVVSIIQSCSQGMNKVVEALQQKFSDVSKTQLRNTVREISDFEDNRWQVKKEVLSKLGLTPSPDKSVKTTKTISSFFSKRCLPPSSKSPAKSSLKPGTDTEEPNGCKHEND